MYCIISDSDDPFFNIAVEEILLRKNTEEFLILAINRTSVIVGKHQSTHREINTRFVSENKIPVLRRISGGGTVFHDPGNLNFTFIRNSEAGSQIDFPKFTRPVIDFLASAGINARLEGKSDIKVNGLKISGNAEHVHRNRVLHHGTVLFSASIETLGSCLRKDTSCYTTHAVKSNPSPVTTLRELMPDYKDITGFRSGMMDFFMKIFPGSEMYNLSEDERSEATALAGSKYNSWDWIYAYGPEYEFRTGFLFKGRDVTIRLYAKGGIIWDCLIQGSEFLSGIDKKLIGCRHMPEDVKEVLRKEKREDLDVFNLF
jgi:lipoate-protein ligase A